MYKYNSTKLNNNNHLNKSGIYRILNTQDQKCYIGSAKNIRKRLSVHLCNLEKGRHHSKHLQSAWNKYGKAVFEMDILKEYVGEKEKLLEEEQQWINHFNSSNPDFGYNIQTDTKNINLTSLQHYKKMSKSAKLVLKGSKLSDEHKLKIKKETVIAIGVSVVALTLTGKYVSRFDTIQEASDYFGVCYNTIRRVVNGERRKYKNYILLKESLYDPSVKYSEQAERKGVKHRQESIQRMKNNYKQRTIDPVTKRFSKG